MFLCVCVVCVCVLCVFCVRVVCVCVLCVCVCTYVCMCVCTRVHVSLTCVHFFSDYFKTAKLFIPALLLCCILLVST